MHSVMIVTIGIAGMLFGWFIYSKFIASKIFKLDPDFVTPAHQINDGVDFVPTNKYVLWGHHFTSVAGAAVVHDLLHRVAGQPVMISENSCEITPTSAYASHLTDRRGWDGRPIGAYGDRGRTWPAHIPPTLARKRQRFLHHKTTASSVDLQM